GAEAVARLRGLAAARGAVFDLAGICGTSPDLRLLLRRHIEGDRRLDQRFEGTRIELLTFVDVDRPSRAAFEAGVEELPRVRQGRALGERGCDSLCVAL